MSANLCLRVQKYYIFLNYANTHKKISSSMQKNINDDSIFNLTILPTTARGSDSRGSCCPYLD